MTRWKLVPLEPTFEMIYATPEGSTTVSDIYKLMIEAAPATPSSYAKAIGYLSKPIEWRARQSETVVKITSEAQPAHGFVFPIYAFQVAGTLPWPTMPPSKGQSNVLFEDGYAEGWAKCLSMCRAALGDFQ